MMKINKNSNAYIILYSTVMVVVVALVLAFAAMSLQPRQKANKTNETKSAILASIGQGQNAGGTTDKFAYIDEQYSKYIAESFAVDNNGDVVADADAFALLGSLKKEYAKADSERALPVFVGKKESGEPLYILPLYGTGLWGPIWGYLALESDMQTVYGVVFDHQGETPGLGAEIATPAFSGQFNGKSVFRGDELVGISVLKGAGSSTGNSNAVDAVSGGTITSLAVQKMIMAGLDGYAGYIEKMKGGPTVVSPEPETTTTTPAGESAPDLPVIQNEPLTVEGNE